MSNTDSIKAKLKHRAIKETFENRKTTFDTISAFEEGFSSDPYRKRMWTSFLKAKKISINLELDKVINAIINFLNPLIETEETTFNSRWNHSTSTWE